MNPSKVISRAWIRMLTTTVSNGELHHRQCSPWLRDPLEWDIHCSTTARSLEIRDR
jgi:hypothetical protein